MRILEEWFSEFAKELDKIDDLYKNKRSIDEKTYQFICFAMAIKGRSVPYVRKHFKGALESGATLKELEHVVVTELDINKESGFAMNFKQINKVAEKNKEVGYI